MPNRRTFLLILIVVVLAAPAKSVVSTWGRRQLAVNPEGSVMHGVGEVITVVTQ
jgi:hypothetical protein